MDDSNNKNTAQPAQTSAPQPAPESVEPSAPSVSPQDAPQPTPAPAPAMPEQPAQPVPPVAPQGYVMPPKKGLSKGALWGIIGGSVGLLLIAGGVVCAVIFLGGPNKQDYKEAYDLVMSSKISDAGASMRGLKGDEYAQKAEKLVDEIDDINKKIGTTKAMRDKDVKAAYDKYAGEWDKLKPKLKKFIAAVVPYQKFSTACTSSVYGFTPTKSGEEGEKEFEESMADCYKALADLKKSDDQEIAKFADKMKEYYDAMKKYAVISNDRLLKKDYSTLSLPSRPKDPSLSESSPFYSLGKDLSLKETSGAHEELKNILEKKAK